MLDYDFVGLDRASALQRFLAEKAAPIGRPLRLRVQLRSFDAVCRMVECNVGIGIVPESTARRVERTMAIAIVELTDPWAVRDLTICIRDSASCRPMRASWSSICGLARRRNMAFGKFSNCQEANAKFAPLTRDRARRCVNYNRRPVEPGQYRRCPRICSEQRRCERLARHTDGGCQPICCCRTRTDDRRHRRDFWRLRQCVDRKCDESCPLGSNVVP